MQMTRASRHSCLPSVDPMTRDLPGPRIDDQARRLVGAIVQKSHARTVAAIHDELIARRADRCDRCTWLEIEDRKRSSSLDQELAILDGDSKIGPCYFRFDNCTGDRHVD